ncbi:IscS subfamily cysteine desulfurase [Pantoea sp. Mhis]|uniref:IscS subfamily cysteine desulfurase n=1 Tax=Pantoea sp. Mhis TaxID=2576759 RepID=UPI00135A6561|nr:IscS subfamily cysteine desulfurase [Pantoea sp. Mhis]MXP56600.1 IscS subfamily cysteine desulfurase [Pantoea sp. Mhis]
MQLPIYLDNAATTPVDRRVVDKMMRYLTVDGIFGNPASRTHSFGWQAEEAVDISRQQIAKLINADPREIIFTSGATESNNLAIKGITQFNNSRNVHIITSQTEHKSVLDSCVYLRNKGFEVTFLKPRVDGIINSDMLKSALRENTILVSLMHVNNETGVIQNIESLGNVCHTNNIIFHVDATQSIGKLPIDVSNLPIDLLSCSAHKLYGPKGIGALWIRRKLHIKINAQIHGGDHQRGIRSGTLPVHQIVGMGEAYRIAHEEITNEMVRFKLLRERFLYGISKLKNISINGSLEMCIPNIVNISFKHIEAESLMIALKDLALSSSSACNSASLEPSYVLLAMGIKQSLAYNSIRFSFGRFNTEEEIDYVVNQVNKTVMRLQSLNYLTSNYF